MKMPDREFTIRHLLFVGVSVTHAHGLAYLLQRFVSDFVRTLVAIMQDVADGIHVLGQLGTAFTVWC